MKNYFKFNYIIICLLIFPSISFSLTKDFQLGINFSESFIHWENYRSILLFDNDYKTIAKLSHKNIYVPPIIIGTINYKIHNNMLFRFSVGYGLPKFVQKENKHGIDVTYTDSWHQFKSDYDVLLGGELITIKTTSFLIDLSLLFPITIE